MPLPIVPLLLSNWQLIAKGIGIAIVAFACWWFFVHNPKVIEGLEKDKAELQRRVEAGEAAITLLDDIQKGRSKVNAETFKNISTIKAARIPKRAVLIHGGLPLPPSNSLPNAANGAKTRTP